MLEPEDNEAPLRVALAGVQLLCFTLALMLLAMVSYAP